MGFFEGRMIRKNYIVRPVLQIKYLATVICVITLTAVATYFAFWSSLVRSAGLEQLSAGDMKAFERAYQINFIWVVVVLVAAFGIMSVLVFHRLVGPIFVMQRAMKNLANGDLSQDVSLRKNDELKDTAGELQNMIDHIRDAVLEDRKKIQDVSAKLPSDVKHTLSTVTQWFKL
jgi:methyl-accepting chemotaxis protein